ncbi:hypothetical protein QZH41_018051 [Actinostola sp. cb2023]|nr:hypothetical protein QZH41_018051 [Actinostola sp. cb2023]
MIWRKKTRLKAIKELLNQKKRPQSFSLVLDNFDLKVHASDMTSDNQNKDEHWCNHNAVLDRVNPTELEDERSIGEIIDVPNSTFVPSLEEQADITNDFVILIARVFVVHLKAFEIFDVVVPKHIKHKYSENMKEKSKKVNLGIIFKDENLGEDMIDIVRELHKTWVPSLGEDGPFDKVPIIGDQKTVERGVESQFSVSNAYTRERRLEGLFFSVG